MWSLPVSGVAGGVRTVAGAGYWVLLAKLAGAMKGNLTKAAGLFQAPLAQVARLAAALQEKREQDGSAEG